MTDTGSGSSSSIDTLRLAVIWFGTVLGTLELQPIVLAITGLFTALQIYILLRDKIFNRKG